LASTWTWGLAASSCAWQAWQTMLGVSPGK
jgi:hypothetical protein